MEVVVAAWPTEFDRDEGELKVVTGGTVGAGRRAGDVDKLDTLGGVVEVTLCCVAMDVRLLAVVEI